MLQDVNATIVAAGGGKRLTLGELDLAGVEKWVDHKKAQVRGDRGPRAWVGVGLESALGPQILVLSTKSAQHCLVDCTFVGGWKNILVW
jgi:hypothetical protein